MIPGLLVSGWSGVFMTSWVSRSEYPLIVLRCFPTLPLALKLFNLALYLGHVRVSGNFCPFSLLL